MCSNLQNLTTPSVVCVTVCVTVCVRARVCVFVCGSYKEATPPGKQCSVNTDTGRALLESQTDHLEMFVAVSFMTRSSDENSLCVAFEVYCQSFQAPTKSF